jgi:hypothetical protein
VSDKWTTLEPLIVPRDTVLPATEYDVPFTRFVALDGVNPETVSDTGDEVAEKSPLIIVQT